MRPDLCYAVKELARALSAPTVEDLFNVNHVLRYVKGSWDQCLTVRPILSLAHNESTIDVICECGSDWAGCQSTRTYTTGVMLFLLGVVPHFSSNTRAIPALS